MILIKLFYEFFKIGLFAIGGGLATIPFLTELSEKTSWFSIEELTNMIAISESTPGPIGVNMASYVGFTSAGVLGSIIATLGLITPSIIVILLISKILQKFRTSSIVKNTLNGLKPASMALITAAGIGVVRIALLNEALFAATGKLLDLFELKSILLAAVLAVGIWKFKRLHPIVFIGISAVVGVVFGLI